MAKTQTSEEKDQNAPATPAPAATFTQADLANEVETVAAALAKQPKRKLRLPLPEGVTPAEAENGTVDFSETVQINGYVVRIKRGHWVEVPESIAEILENAGKI